MASYPRGPARISSQRLFPTQGPVAARQLIGREDDLESLFSQVRAGNHQIIAGPRRTGKTSVCDVVAETMRDGGSYLVKLDLFGLDSLASLAEGLAHQAIANRPAIRKVLPRLVEAGRGLARGAAAAVSGTIRAEFGSEVEIGFANGIAERDPARYFEWSLRLLDRIAAADGRQLLLYIDEFQELAAGGHRFGEPDSLTKKMRSILQRSPHVTCLFAGSIEHMMHDLFAVESRAFYQFGGFYELRTISGDAWREGLRDAFSQDHCDVAEAALDRLVEHGESHPRSTMLVAQQAHVVAVEQGRFDLDVPLVDQGLAYAMDQERPTHEGDVVRIRGLGRYALRVVRSVALDESVYVGTLDPKQVGRALGALRDAGFVANASRGTWRVVDPLLRRYIERF